MTQTLTLADGSKFVGKVDGSKQTGTLTKPNGDVYTGTFTDGKLEGKGTLKTASGNSYDGNFAGGQPSGSGTMKYANGTTYTGSWADGQRSGSGTVNYANGDRVLRQLCRRPAGRQRHLHLGQRHHLPRHLESRRSAERRHLQLYRCRRERGPFRRRQPDHAELSALPS